jgi:putative methyltransferase (TIGR04325 family)
MAGNILRALIPPILLRVLGSVRKSGVNTNGATLFEGNFASYDEARSHSTGYDAEVIVTRVRDAMLKVKAGEAVCERDGVVFDRMMCSFPVVAGLLNMALARQGSLSVLDFGGSLGTSYFQYHSFLGEVKQMRWSVVEQPQFVDCGRELFEDAALKFYYDIDECLVSEMPDVILLSGVIQYLSDPHMFLGSIIDRGFECIILDRTPFIQTCSIVPKLSPDLLTVQFVPPSVYDASIPTWFFDETNFLRHFAMHYELLASFDSFESVNMDWVKTQSKGYIFRKTNTGYGDEAK